ncbi:HalOD1 output domain-containing protein [Halobaculum magnesiiphilum]|uniref:Halobacterial output domain-containing protein n=1 Tax=Halobaculum magnesiiphilum TaxID=1017351 RepID=A0A8T8WHU3_9EURY|nr:HalOD1 output domain-containing protein [Halobaculum magnesiiphilum]QZP39435.1 hypothetical protein K6T50_17770 [Halobaculum magnesiiphilum]
MADGSDEDGSCGDDEIAHAQYDWSSTAPSIAVVETLALAFGREAATLEPLFDAVDPDALDAFFQSESVTESATEVVVTFTVAGRRVTVRGGGGVLVRSNSDDE